MDNLYVQKYLQEFNINQKDVGAYLAEGGQHYVYHYKQNQVIKIPKQSFLMRLYGMYKLKTMIRTNQLVNEIFGEYTIKSEVIPSRDNKKYLVTQEYLADGKIITHANFPSIKDQFMKLITYNRVALRHNKKCLDFISFFGFFKTLRATLTRNKKYAVMENILIVGTPENPKLKIIDFNLLEVRLLNFKISPVHWLVDRFFYLATKGLIRDNFGVKL